MEDVLRSHVRGLYEWIVEDELSQVLERLPSARGGKGYRNGHRERTILTTHGPTTLSLPRARIWEDSCQREFHSSVVPKGRRMTPKVEALLASAYLCGVSTRKVKSALAKALGPGVSKSTVSRALQALRPEWEAWQSRNLERDGIVRLYLDGFVAKVRMGRTTLKVSVLAAMGVTWDGQKVLLALKGMGGESKEAWREVLDDLAARGLGVVELCIVDGSPGLRAAIFELWPEMPVQRCTLHKERNLLAAAPKSLHDELKSDYREVVYADTSEQAMALRKAFDSKWSRLCPKVATSFREAGDELFTFLKFPGSQWKSLRTTNVIERLNGEFRRRIKVQAAHPSSESVCMLFWALIAFGAVNLRKVDGWTTLAAKPKNLPLASQEAA
jgi:transposase-like protein